MFADVNDYAAQDLPDASDAGQSLRPLSELHVGLRADEALRRLREFGPNELPTAKKRSLIRQAWDVLHEPMLLLLVAAGSINFVLSEPLDGTILLSFVIVVVGISIYQEHKSENALAALRDLSAPRALVIRDGETVRIAGKDVVVGDVVLLSEGDRVPADSVVIECENLGVDESALTGESVPVRKSRRLNDSAMGAPGGDGTPWLFSGTLVVRGHGIAVVETTGSRTEIGRIGTVLRSIERQRTPMQTEVDRLVRVVAAIGTCVALIVVATYGFVRGQWLDALLAGIATAMAILPEEFPVILTVFLAVGAWRMSQRHVLARHSPVIETLGSASVICVDKTGTLTVNAMTVRVLSTGDRSVVVTDESLPDEFRSLAIHSVLASPSNPYDPMDKAFHALRDRFFQGSEDPRRDLTLVREYSLSENLFAVSFVWRLTDEPNYVVAAKGAPEAIAELCHFGASEHEGLIRQVETATADGCRVVAVACATHDSRKALPADQHGFAFELLGLVSLHDPVRAGVGEAVAECSRAGVRTVMITGDYPGTAIAIAREIGLDNCRDVITGAELAAMTEGELAARIQNVSVFARMVPTQKLQLIKALKANGDIVAMTGDGVNDAPALRAADIGIAMGARGTDVAREAADLVITDDDFASIVGGIRQGRGIFENIRKAMVYVIAVHVPIVGMSILPLLGVKWPLVLLPVQIAFLELIIDPACSIVFEAEPMDPRTMERPSRASGTSMFDRRVLTIAILQGLSVLAAVGAVYIWTVIDGRSDQAVRSVTFATLVFANLQLILVNRSWRLSVRRTLFERRNPTLKWIVLLAVGLLTVLFTTPQLRTAFGLAPPSPRDVIVSLGASFLGVAWFEVYKQRRS